MRSGRYLEQLDQSIWIARILQVITLVMAIAILLLAKQRTIIHVAPPTIEREYWIGPTNASREYIEQMAAFYATTVLTVNPDNALFAARAFLQQLTPDARGRLEATLMGEATYIKNHGLTQAFYPKAMDFLSARKLRITGTTIQWIAGKVVTQRNVSYTMTLEVNNYGVKIADFERIQQDGTHPSITSVETDSDTPDATP
jgi:conjugal transfer pilus assembly protein TraE